jgi:hypothetical protein
MATINHAQRERQAIPTGANPEVGFANVFMMIPDFFRGMRCSSFLCLMHLATFTEMKSSLALRTELYPF